ncbi:MULTISPECIES: metal ABC transporter solute-binding protein, Zn/Mn family [Staphylococcus]|uniref:Zinc ABC transporter substrate-binding protein n=1 Tax=Staphylococcus hsinchuensis TaxID=3051183 RepID=A0ABZ3EE76_9STAP|nr:zinc ABC transporter substrate-binding protein [Staphylococcus sp. Marseille-Q6910]
MKKSLVIILISMLIVVLSGCSQSNHSEHKQVSESNKLNIYTTAFAFQSFAQQIGGKYVKAESIYPPGADAHSFEPTQKEMINIAKSDLFIYSDEEMDPVAKKIAQSIKDDNLKLPVVQGIDHHDLISSHEHEHHHDDHGGHHEGESHDPHVWLDPVLDKKLAYNIKQDLIRKDPKHKKYYNHNYQNLKQDLTQIDEQLKAVTKNPKRDTVVISHDSIGYLAHRYHFKQQGVSGINNEEPTQQNLVKIVHSIKDSKQPYVLYEQNISSKVTNVIEKESDTQPLDFHNMAMLTKAQKNDKNITFQSLMKKNIHSLDKALNQ